MITVQHTSARSLAGAGLTVAALLLAACGGGSYVELPPEPATSVPTSATASVSAWTSYVAGLPVSEGAAPLEMDGITPPVSETAEPALV